MTSAPSGETLRCWGWAVSGQGPGTCFCWDSQLIQFGGGVLAFGSWGRWGCGKLRHPSQTGVPNSRMWPLVSLLLCLTWGISAAVNPGKATRTVQDPGARTGR